MTTTSVQIEYLIHQGPNRARLARSWVDAGNANVYRNALVYFEVSAPDGTQHTVHGEVVSMNYLAGDPIKYPNVVHLKIAIDGDFETLVPVVYDVHWRRGMMLLSEAL